MDSQGILILCAAVARIAGLITAIIAIKLWGWPSDPVQGFVFLIVLIPIAGIIITLAIVELMTVVTDIDIHDFEDADGDNQDLETK